MRPNCSAARAATYAEAAGQVRRGPWGRLAFLAGPEAAGIARKLDDRVAEGAAVLPPPNQIFAAFDMTPPETVRAVILGQDPYPTPGDAHGLAFSLQDRSRRLPMSLRTILASLENDLGIAHPGHGNLTAWARAGVLLLNVSLSVEAGKANSHKHLGWSQLTGEVLDMLNSRPNPVVFMLWGGFAQKAGAKLDRERHCVIETVHPSPLARGPGPVHRFVAAQPFAKARDWLAQRHLPAIDWRL
jgi:uracil-DNA glycosylase